MSTVKESLVSAYREHKMLIWIVLIAVVLATAFYWFYGDPDTEVFKTDSAWKHDLDSIEASNRNITAAMLILQARRTDDSTKLVTLKSKLDSIPFVLTSITDKYEKERASIIALPFSDRLRFFSDWVSEGGGMAR